LQCQKPIFPFEDRKDTYQFLLDCWRKP
jgi:hypothetical protein